MQKKLQSISTSDFPVQAGPAYFSQEQLEPLFLHSLQEQQQQEGEQPPQPDPSLPPVGDVNQQQQQQQATTFVDPFADLDPAMLPDHVRTAVEKARGDLQRLQKADVTARQFQSTHDKQQAEINRLRQETETLRQQSQGADPSRQNQQQREETTEEMLIKQYMSEGGVTPEIAAKMAKINAPILENMQQKTIKQMQQQMGPLANMVINDQAAGAFETIRAQDQIGWSNIPEVAQKTWDGIQAVAANGQVVTPDLAANLSRIHFMNYVEEHGFPTSFNPRQQPQQQQPQQFVAPHMSNTVQQPQSVSTRFNYPGSLVMPQRQQPQQQQQFDPDVVAAMAATTANWIVKPKAFRNGK